MKTLAALLVAILTTHIAADEPAFALVSVLTDATALAGLHDVELDGRHAYVAGKGGTVAIIDIENRENPVILWSKQHKLFDDAETVLPFGKHLFLGSRNFHAFDISTPAKSRLLHTLQDPPRIDRINGMVRFDHSIFAANKDGWIDAFNITDPTQPKLAGARDVNTRDGVKSPHDIDRLGSDHIVITDPNGFGRRNDPGRVAVYQIADRGKIRPAEQWSLVGKLENPLLAGGNRVRVRGTTAVVAASISPKAENAKDRKPVVALVDLSNPATPRVLSSVPFPDTRGPNGLCLHNHVAFTAGGQTILAIDVSDVTKPVVLGSFKSEKLFPAGDADAHDLAFRDGYLYCTGQNSHSFGIVKVVSPRILELTVNSP